MSIPGNARGSTGKRSKTLNRFSGAALLLVVWLLALMSALILVFATAARVEAMQGRLQREDGQWTELARAGLEYALVRVLDNRPASHWQPDGKPYAWQFAGHELEIRLIDASGQVDLNQADAAMLAALLGLFDESAGQAESLAAAIVDWRDADAYRQVTGGAEDADYAAAGLPYGAKDAPFGSLQELRQILGMPSGLADRLIPHVTLHAGRSRPDPQFASSIVLAAMARESTLAMPATPRDDTRVHSGTGTYTIESRVRHSDTRVALLRATVRLGGTQVPGTTYTVLDWEQGWETR